LTAVLVLANAAVAFGSGEPQESFLYQNFVRASEVLDRAIAAHGGADLLDRSANVRVAFTGTLRYQGHYPRPWAHLDYRMDGTTAYSASLRALKSEGTFTEGDKPTPYFVIVGPANGIKLDGGATKPDSVPERELAKTLRDELEILPHEYLRQARAGAASLRLLSGSDGFDVLVYTLDGGDVLRHRMGGIGGDTLESFGRALYFAADTHLLMRVERIGHWKHKGDRLEWRTFDDYVDRSGVQVPLRSQVHAEESSSQYDILSEITKIEFGGAVEAGEFAVPEAYRAGFEAWALEERKPEDPLEPLPSHDLGNGAYVIDLPPSDARSLLVEFSDFAVVVEAGDYSEISARILATADRLLPGKPVRYVAMTHHHPLYACGLRPYAQRGITILATAGDTAYYRDLTTRPYRIHPDEQERSPREPKFEVIDKKRVIKDGKQRLELHEYDYTTHVDEFVLPYLPSHKLIVTADQVYILRDDEIRPASGRERAIHRVVKERKLAVKNIMQTWFLTRSDDQVPYSILEEKIRLAEARDAKK
jgi:glyoxylase-like metal-dependent hydrolase (beta-lactamase superfamily II)